MGPRIAIAGSGALSRYLAEELTANGFAVTILGRTPKSYFDNMSGVNFRKVDFNSVESIKEALGNDTEVLISAILDYTMGLNDAQLNMIKAASESPKTRRFIPSEFGGNVEDYPDQTPFYYKNREPSRKVLREQSLLEWTIVSTSWFIDWIVPEGNHYFPDAGDAFPVNLKGGSFFIPGAGTEKLDMIAARDAAKGVVELIKAPYGSWEHYVYLSGEKSDWNTVTKQVQRAYPDINFKRSTISLTQMIENIIKGTNEGNEEAVIEAQYQVFGVSNAGNFDVEKTAAQKETFFKDVHFRSVQEFLDQYKQDPTIIV
jgi:nucleoside-diphosphate-sugar epimerase